MKKEKGKVYCACAEASKEACDNCEKYKRIKPDITIRCPSWPKVHINDLNYIYGHINASINRLDKIVVAETTKDLMEKSEVMRLMEKARTLLDGYV